MPTPLLCTLDHVPSPFPWQAVSLLERTQGIKRAQELAAHHCSMAAEMVGARGHERGEAAGVNTRSGNAAIGNSAPAERVVSGGNSKKETSLPCR